ncbi:hypothetical protein [uncultured Paraglaciecola sp.]|uniref:hypothetical protein n=1 Tax=uncultured Paraglaciecola sp. TaxID=1765024 RepID=UPI0030D93C49
MRRFALILPVLAFSSFAAEDSQTQQYSVGIGMGALYSGLGANLALVSKNDMKYLSAGCVEYSSRFGSTCGFGAGWVTTDLFNFDNNKHGFGIYASIAGREHSYRINPDMNGRTYQVKEHDIYGLGVSYTYFFNGINRSGTTLGISIHGTNADFESSVGGFLQIGYQF